MLRSNRIVNAIEQNHTHRTPILFTEKPSKAKEKIIRPSSNKPFNINNDVYTNILLDNTRDI